MNRLAAPALIALVGLSSAYASAGRSVTLSFAADSSFVGMGDTINWTVTASFTGFDDSNPYFGGFVGSFVAENSGDFVASNFTNRMTGEGTAPTANGGSVENVNIFNSALLGTEDFSNPMDIFSFSTTVTDQPGGKNARFISFDADGVVSMFENDGIFTLPIVYDGPGTFNVVSDRVLYSGIFPAPAGAAVLLMAGAVLARRRRT